MALPSSNHPDFSDLAFVPALRELLPDGVPDRYRHAGHRGVAPGEWATALGQRYFDLGADGKVFQGTH